jgi:lipid-A-disaccharide synthase
MIAGEPSGDLHGSGVVRALKSLAPDVEIIGIGGDMMRREGMELIHHISELSFMGFVEVVRHLGVIRRVERKLLDVLRRRRPDVVTLIDYPGFNLRFARKAKAEGCPVLYYISPQVWAWNRRRVKKMKKTVDRMMVVFPFEVDIYKQEGIPVEFVGHPLVERLSTTTDSREQFCVRYGLDPGKKILALLPGSRIQEIEHMFPVMVETARMLSEGRALQVAVGVASGLGPERLRRFLPGNSNITLIEQGTYDLMARADAAIVTSGTATLETGWFGTPMAVVYRTSPVTYSIGRMLVHVPYIGLVNIVAGRQVVPEFVQHNMVASKIAPVVGKMLDDVSYARTLSEGLSVIRPALGRPGASRRVAEAILRTGKAA